jgi:hypothetical protein
MKTAAEFLRDGAATFEGRNKVYGNNFLKIGHVMAGLFPAGVELKSVQDWNRMHILLLQIVKLSRYCNNWETGHADSIHDNTVYSAILESIDAMGPGPDAAPPPASHLRRQQRKRVRAHR